MNWKRIAKGTIVLGIVGNVIDYVLNTYLLTGITASLGDVMREPNIVGFVVGDLVAAFMLMLAWELVGSRFGTGLMGGLKFGLAAGALITFPTFLFIQMQFRGIPYGLAWTMIVVVTAWYGVLGAVAGILNGKAAPA